MRAVFGVRAWRSPVDRELDATLGWRPVANLSLERDLPGFGHVRHSTTQDGFRVFGDPATTRLKVLVVGDSFKEAATVSDGETYYERLGRARPDIEIFAIGAGGYGTLQEYLLLDRWVDVIRPGLILVQAHPNDVVNNSHALESRSTTDNNQMTRPYWEDGRVVPRFPENAAWGPLYNLAILEKYYLFHDDQAARWFDAYWRRSQDDPDGLAAVFGKSARPSLAQDGD